jgi:hypothetical protein
MDHLIATSPKAIDLRLHNGSCPVQIIRRKRALFENGGALVILTREANDTGDVQVDLHYWK